MGKDGGQPSLHSFFTPKASTSSGRTRDDAVDLTTPPPDERPVKRAKVSGYFTKSGTDSSKLKATFTSLPRLGDYRLSRKADQAPPPKQRTAEEEQRHEQWQNAVLGRSFFRRRSLQLDDAAAIALREQLGEDANGQDPTSGSATPATLAPEEDQQPESSAAASLRAKFAAPPTKGRGKKKEDVGPSGMTYTPLEKQFMAIKERWPGVLLMMEGLPPRLMLTWRFYGEDAKTAARELGIVAFPNRNFYTASIPVHRLHVHVKKLISLGYKVGVVSQTETAALKKVGDNRNTPFTRELTHLYTSSTYVEESSASSSTVRDAPVVPGSALSNTGALVTIVEDANDKSSRIALVSVIPGTGEVVWDEFEDSRIRNELETRLTHLQPAELLLPEELSKETRKVIDHLTVGRSTADVRKECVEQEDYATAFDFLTQFYKEREAINLTGEDAEMEDGAPEEAAEIDVLELVNFPKPVVVALSMVVKYITEFKLQEVFRHRSAFTRFTDRKHMLLSANTLVNLEIYRNQTDGGLYGSLLWLLDHTKTKMGRRLMREWIGRPLLDVGDLRARANAIEEVITTNSYQIEKLRSLLVNMPDLVRGLTRAQYGKTTPNELSAILTGLVRVGTEFRPENAAGFRSDLLNDLVRKLPTIKDAASGLLAALNMKAAKNNEEAALWQDQDRYPPIQDAKDCIDVCSMELDQHLVQVKKALGRPHLKYVTVSGIEFLIEIPHRDAKIVPPKWVKVSGTKAVSRYHTPEVINMIKELEQHRETLSLEAKSAFKAFQEEVAEHREFLVVARELAVIDCLTSLANVAQANGYVKPTFVAEPCLRIESGRHPMVEALRDDQYVPFDITFGDKEGRTKVITGPNMAGKSSCVRAVALMVCMAQMGSFVPASSMTLGIHDAVQTRMGASDEIARGKSTFMVEMTETSDILRTVTPRTLVVLDELGRGTSTFDGVAIAYATLSHLASLDIPTLFVTHYPLLSRLEAEYSTVSNWHMAFTETPGPSGPEITFLYKLRHGLADASFGIWCARLAGLPDALLQRAQEKSQRMREETRDRGRAAVGKYLRALVEGDVAAAEKLEGAMAYVDAAGPGGRVEVDS